MVGVLAAQIIDVQSHLRMIDETLKEFMRKIDIEAADHRTFERNVEFEPGAAGKIHDYPRERFIQWNIGVAIAAYAFLVADGFGKRLTQRDADILDRVMRIDMQVALGADVEIDQPVARNLVQHMIEKGNTGIQLLLASAVEVDRYPDLGLAGIADDFCCACHGLRGSGIQAGFERCQELLILGRGAHGDPQAVFQQSMHSTDIFHEHLLCQKAFKDLRTRQACP